MASYLLSEYFDTNQSINPVRLSAIGTRPSLTNTGRWTNVGLMLAHCLLRWFSWPSLAYMCTKVALIPIHFISFASAITPTPQEWYLQIYIHLKLELQTSFPASNDEKLKCNVQIYWAWSTEYFTNFNIIFDLKLASRKVHIRVQKCKG